MTARESLCGKITEERHIDSIKRKIGTREFVVLMAVLMATNGFAIDIMLPALEQIKNSFHISGLNAQQYVIFAFLGGFAIAQLFFGPVSDSFGRRPPLILGLILYIAVSFACAYAPSFEALLCLRAAQGVSAAAMRVITVSIIRDIYHGRKMAEIMSVTMIIFMIVPIIAPACGNLILHFGSWHTIFKYMSYAGIAILLWVLYRLPETLHQKRPFNLASLNSAFFHVLHNRISLCYSLAFSVMLGALFCALTTAPQIFDGIYHLGALFPLAFAAVALAQAIAAYANAKLVVRLGMRTLSHSLLLSFIAATFIWSVWSFAAGTIPFLAHMALFTVIMFSFGAIGANFNSLAMEPLGKYAGTASSVFGFLQTSIGAVLGIMIAQCFNGTTLPIAIGFFLLGLTSLLLVLTAEKGRLFNESHTKS